MFASAYISMNLNLNQRAGFETRTRFVCLICLMDSSCLSPVRFGTTKAKCTGPMEIGVF